MQNIHDEHRLSQINLENTISEKKVKQRRKTQLRLEARTKLKKLKTMSQVDAFSTLNDTQIAKMIDIMERATF